MQLPEYKKVRWYLLCLLPLLWTGIEVIIGKPCTYLLYKYNTQFCKPRRYLRFRYVGFYIYWVQAVVAVYIRLHVRYKVKGHAEETVKEECR